MTFPAPCPPWSVRQRLRLRQVRREVGYAVAGLLRRLVEQLDPPAEHLARARVERDASRARHPSVEDGYAQGRADLQLVHGHREPAGWVDCSLGVISATRPFGAEVRFRDLDGAPQEGTLLTLGASEVSLVYYRLGLEVYTPEGPELLLWDLPLSHPLEVLRHD